MDVLLAKPIVVGLAILGGILAAAASYLQMRGYVSEKISKVINWAGYGAMGASMLLFVLSGLWR
jgi:hypothetical protein